MRGIRVREAGRYCLLCGYLPVEIVSVSSSRGGVEVLIGPHGDRSMGMTVLGVRLWVAFNNTGAALRDWRLNPQAKQRLERRYCSSLAPCCAIGNANKRRRERDEARRRDEPTTSTLLTVTLKPYTRSHF